MKDIIIQLSADAPVIAITFIATIALCSSYSYLKGHSERKRMLSELITNPTDSKPTTKDSISAQRELKVKRLMKVHVITSSDAQLLQEVLDEQVKGFQEQARQLVTELAIPTGSRYNNE